MKKAIKICLWLLAFIPLVVDNNVFFPFTSGKSLLLQLSLVLVSILFLINFFYSRAFKVEIIEKAAKYIKHPLVLSVLAFIFIFIISTIFAVDKYAAFWGDLNRAEGLVSLIFFFAFFVFSLLIFEKKDWFLFFKLSLFTGFVVLFREFIEYLGGMSRPESFIGNATFLSGYLLFSITASLIVLNEEKNKFFKYLSIIVIILSLVGIFLAQTRGTILGLGLGVIAVLVYGAIRGRDISYKKINLRKISAGLLCFGVLFVGVFIVTRQNEIWQKIPGLSRVAIIQSDNIEDPSTSIRLSIYKSSLESINPIGNGWRKLLIGWGPENFILADSKYYDAGQYKYETKWYDRAHNKFLDVLVMNGVFGLLAYLSVWFFFFASLRRGRESIFSFIDIGLLFFGTSYLTHLMFVFDDISTYLVFFVTVSFLISITVGNTPDSHKKPPEAIKSRDSGGLSSVAILVVLTLFLGFVFVRNTLPGYLQMRSYFPLVRDSSPEVIEKEIDSILDLSTVAQMNIRKDLLRISNDFYNKDQNENTYRLFKKSLESGEEYVERRPSDFVFLSFLADVYGNKSNILNNPEFINRGEEHFRKILHFAPNRPDITRGLAANLFYQKKYEESFMYFEKTFDLSPELFARDQGVIESVYFIFAKYFYGRKDKEDFVRVAARLRTNNYEDSALLDKILDYLDKTGGWPAVNFK